MYRNLFDYIEKLEQAGELVRISTFVDPVLEICELTDRESKRKGGGRALLFENTGTDFPVLTNMMGSDRRIAMALGVDNLDELTDRIEELFGAVTTPRQGFFDKLSLLPTLGEVAKWMPRRKRGRGDCQQVVLSGDDALLDKLPVLKCWPYDGGRFVTLPLVNTLDPENGTRNVGMYRMQIFDEHTTGMHWHLHKTGERHYRAYQRAGQRMPVSVCLGGDPAYTYSATAPMPDNMDEYLLAGFIRRRPVELVKCITNDIMVPSDCDFVIEGYVDPIEDKVVEGPFGDHTGFYSLEDMYPKFHVTAITHRRGAVYPATIVGVPPQEDAYIAKATEKIFLAPIRLAIVPEMRDLWMPEEGVAHNIAVANIEKSYEGQGLKTASALWGAGQMMFNKFMMVTATSQDIRDADVLRKLLCGLDVRRDIVFGRGPLDVLDHASDVMGLGGKMLFDATGVDESPAECMALPILPELWQLPFGVTAVDDTLASDWLTLLVRAKRDAVVDAVRLLDDNGVDGVKYVVILDDAVDTTDHRTVLWLTAGNTDPSRDVKLYGGVLVFDARVKAGVDGFNRRWPNVVTSSDETIALVDSRAPQYGIGDLPPSPSLKYKTLCKGDSADYSAKSSM